MNIYLTGYRCTGKTTIGKMLAKKIGISFIDADAALIQTFNKSVAEIVEKGGWEDFRDKETAILKKLSTLENHVIATGGGVILRDENVSLMRDTGKVLWLKAEVETIAHRMAGDSVTETQRPGLTDKGVLMEIEEVLGVRTPLYKVSSDRHFNSDAASPETICDAIIAYLRAGGCEFKKS
jgi:shikimate kinase